MAVSEPTAVEPDAFDPLIEAYIEPDAPPRRVEEARLRDGGYAVWAIVGDLLPPGRTADVVAREYRVSVEAVGAVWAYHLRHRAALDRRLARTGRRDAHALPRREREGRTRGRPQCR